MKRTLDERLALGEGFRSTLESCSSLFKLRAVQCAGLRRKGSLLDFACSSRLRSPLGPPLFSPAPLLPFTPRLGLCVLLPPLTMFALRHAGSAAFRCLVLPRTTSLPPRKAFTHSARRLWCEEFPTGMTWRTVKREIYEDDVEAVEEEGGESGLISREVRLRCALLGSKQQLKATRVQEFDKMLDPTPFRPGVEVEQLKAGQKIELHPMIYDIDFTYVILTRSKSPGARLEVRDEDGEVTLGNAYSDPAVDELVTSPPCARLVVRLQGDLAADIKNSHGVTVRELLDGVGHFWDRPVSEEVAKYYRRLSLYPTADSDVVKEGHFLPKYSMWEGWSRGTQVQQDGSVLLECDGIRGG